MSQSAEDLRGVCSLLVDDQQANLAVLAPNGQVALRNAGRILPDLMLLDVMMSEMDGFEVCRRLKQHVVNLHR